MFTPKALTEAISGTRVSPALRMMFVSTKETAISPNAGADQCR